MRLYLNGHVEHGDAVHSFSIHNHESLGESVSEHAGWEILFGDPVAAKGIEIGLRGVRHDLSKIPGLVYNGLEEHQEFFHRHNTNTRALVIPGDFIDNIWGDIARSSDMTFQRPILEHSDFYHFANSTYNLLRSGDLNKSEISTLIESLVFEMVDSLSHDQASLKNSLNDSLTKLLFKDVLILLHKNLSHSAFCLDDLSSELGVSKFHIIRTLKKIGGFTPHSYLSKIRLIKAKELLIKRENNISAISSLCGFDELSSFNKSFKRNIGISPSDFQRFNS